MWLNALCKNKDIEKERSKKGFSFPLKKIILAEGITEEILLPEFAKNYNYDFTKNGILLISSGGKNQVVKYFYKFADILKLPIFVLLDNDAKQNYEEIKPKLRKQDKIHILKCGEFEDTLSKFLIKRTLNNHFKNFFTVNINDLTTEYPMTKTLDNLLKSHGKEFKKAEFAHLVKDGIQNFEGDAIVNAANSRLHEGGGVCGDIFAAAGRYELTKACNEIGGCKVGECVTTPAFKLHAKYIIHAVSPQFTGGNNGEEENIIYSGKLNSNESLGWSFSVSITGSGNNAVASVTCTKA